MAYRETIQIGHPALKNFNATITDFDDIKIRELITDLTDTMRQNDLVGLAAPQIAENYRLFITEPRQTQSRSVDQTDELRVYINPEIIKYSDEETVIYEGCGSVLNGSLFGPVKRPRTITINAFDNEGKKFQLTCDGLLARVIQHEYDHLNGIEFTEKILDYKMLMAREFYIENIRNSRIQLENSKMTKKEFKYI